MIVVTSDADASEDELARDIVELAQRTAYKERMERIVKWERQLHISVDMSKETCIKVEIDDVVFTEPRKVFPTQELIAKIALAVESGVSNRRKHKIEDFHAADAMRYATLGNHYRTPVRNMRLEEFALVQTGGDYLYGKGGV